MASTAGRAFLESAMSLDVKAVDEAGLRAAIAAVRSDAKPEDWCIVVHNGSPNEIKVRKLCAAR